MASDFLPDDPRELWRGQPLAHARLAADEVRRLAEAFQSRVQRRNLVEYIAGALGLAGHLVIAVWTRSAWVRTGSILVIAAVCYVLYQLHRRAAAICVPEELAPRPGLDFHRSQLERQRDALRGVWSWYILPFLPGLVLVAIASARSTLHAVINLVPLAAISVGVVWLNRRAANRLQREIDRLDSFLEGDSQ